MSIDPGRGLDPPPFGSRKAIIIGVLIHLMAFVVGTIVGEIQYRRVDTLRAALSLAGDVTGCLVPLMIAGCVVGLLVSLLTGIFFRRKQVWFYAVTAVFATIEAVLTYKAYLLYRAIENV